MANISSQNTPPSIEKVESSDKKYRWIDWLVKGTNTLVTIIKLWVDHNSD